MNVDLVTSTGRCGIAEHSQMLMASLEDHDIDFMVDAAWLDPRNCPAPRDHDTVVHLNYHRGLHSRWTPEVIARYAPTPFVITFHDTYERQPDNLPWELIALDNVRGMVVHEPCDLSAAPPPDNPHYATGTAEYMAKVHYWRQPCPDAQGRGIPDVITPFMRGGWRPTLGTLGFGFPWKNYPLLAKVTGELGWNLRVVGQVDDAQQAALQALNPNIWFDGYIDQKDDAVSILSSCDATAFLYTCANSGTSGAIRVGMTAGKPLIAGVGCRQFRDLEGAPDSWPIAWVEPTEQGLHAALDCLVARRAGPQGYNLGLISLAHNNSWTKIGPKYLALYREALR